MRMSEELLKKNNKEKIARQKREIAREEEDVETMTYKPFQRSEALNDSPGIFRSFDEHTLNREKSVFDRTAVFHTVREEERNL